MTQDHAAGKVLRRKRLGVFLMLGGVIPWIVLMAVIVHVKFPSDGLIGATVFCWAVFFAGKTLFREPSARSSLDLHQKGL